MENALEFFIEKNPNEEVMRKLSELEPENPVYTFSYQNAVMEPERELWLFGVRQGQKWITACPGWVNIGRISNRLQINCLPIFPAKASPFWDGLLDACRDENLTSVVLYTFGCRQDTKIPELPGEESRSPRFEYIVDLKPENLWSTLRKGHKYNINKSKKNGLEFRVSKDPAFIDFHNNLMTEVYERRSGRGEKLVVENSSREEKLLLSSGKAEFYQVWQDDTLHSSYLTVRSEKGAYLLTAGNSKEGIQYGASTLAVFAAMEHLKSGGIESFHLGGADQWNEGLINFKLGFRANVIELENAQFYFGSKFKRKIGTLGRKIGRRLKWE
jgi:hypothetical protein